MKYFSIEFPNHTTFIVFSQNEKTNNEWLVGRLSAATGLHGQDSIYNPKYFLSVKSITSPDERQKKVAKDLAKVLF